MMFVNSLTWDVVGHADHKCNDDVVYLVMFVHLRIPSHSFLSDKPKCISLLTCESRGHADHQCDDGADPSIDAHIPRFLQ